MRMILFPILLISTFVAGCSSQAMTKPSELPLEKGTTWDYSYEAYEQSADPDQILKATYKLTESVVDVEAIESYFVAHVKKDYELVNADVDWPGREFTDNQVETWYLVNENQLFESRLPVNTNKIQTDYLLLEYDFPLALNKSWCWIQGNRKNPDSKKIANCESVGRREVTNTGVYETPAGTFEDCYELIDYSNGGDIIQWFCKGVGIVFMKFDHAGTRFGFEQTLLSYSVGVP
jgi:hypothetical protein